MFIHFTAAMLAQISVLLSILISVRAPLPRVVSEESIVDLPGIPILRVNDPPTGHAIRACRYSYDTAKEMSQVPIRSGSHFIYELPNTESATSAAGTFEITTSRGCAPSI